MSIHVRIKKDLGGFQLDTEFQSSSRRIGILGASGCGKTMILKCIAGVESVHEGYIEVNGKIFTDTEIKKSIRPQERNVGYVFQNYALFPTQSVEKNIMAGLTGSRQEKRQRVKEMIGKFQLNGLEKHLPEQLSGGQQQRVALARIMAYEPDIILLDEPFSALDGFLKDQLQQEMIEMLADYEGIVILVSHSRDEIYRFSEELLIMEDGKIISNGATKEIFANPGNAAAAKLTGCKNIVPVKRLDDYSFEIKDWDVVFHSDTPLPQNFDCIGYRAHDFTPVWGEREENCIAVHPYSIAELPFETKYFLKSGNHEIRWFVQRESRSAVEAKGLPQYLKIHIDSILFLKV